MTRWMCAALLIFFCTAPTVTAAAETAPADSAHSPSTRATGLVAQVTLDGPIGPAAAEYFDQASSRAAADGAVAIVLRLDTPGGLADSMRQIINGILASKVPVLCYVAPAGARAASAGTYILYACQVAAMAQATHLGAATPVSLGDIMPKPPEEKSDPAKKFDKDESPARHDGDAESQKVLNDAIAYIRSLAQLRGRNAEWAEAAVRGAATLTASEALEKRVIDFVAADVADLLAQAEGRAVRVGEQSVSLRLKNLEVREYAPNWRTRFLAIITNPTFAYLLLLAGIYGLVLEAFHPGAMLPGIVGGICLLIGLYALQLLPVNYAGLALMALGVGLLIAEAVTPTVGAFGVGGIVAFVVGSILLFDTDVPGYEVNVGVIAGIASCAAALMVLILWLAMRSRRAPRFSGEAQMPETSGELLGAVSADGETWALVGGERWRVRSEVSLPPGARVRVVRRQGLLLWVAPE